MPRIILSDIAKRKIKVKVYKKEITPEYKSLMEDADNRIRLELKQRKRTEIESEKCVAI